MDRSTREGRLAGSARRPAISHLVFRSAGGQELSPVGARERPSDESRSRSIGTRTLLAVAVGYLLAVSVATFPRILSLGTDLPTLSDPVSHLCVLRWYRHCLLNWQNPLIHGGIQAPTGFPIGLNPPMLLATAAYILLSLVIPNDVLIYNVLWLGSFLFAGLGTFVLAWHLTRDCAAAFLGGLLVMLGTPVMLHGYEHLELIQVGWFPLFLLCWIRFVEAPSRLSLIRASIAYLLVAVSAPYFGVMATFPATLYVLYFLTVKQPAFRPFSLRHLPGWLLSFSLIVLPLLVLVFLPQVWVSLKGFSITRPRAEFDTYGATLWSYFLPTNLHALGRLLPVDIHEKAGFEWRLREKASYLGVVTLFLLQLAVVRKPVLPRLGYWWASLVLLVTLSLGSSLFIGSQQVPLPGGWLFDHFPPMSLLRVPGRFNLFALVMAAVIAAGALASWRGRIRRPWLRNGLTAGLVILATADLAITPYGSVTVPEMPGSYDVIFHRGSGSVMLDIPHVFTGHNQEVSPMAAYWQSFHGGRTTAGYSAHGNRRQDWLLAFGSPFSYFDMLDPAYLADPANFRTGPFVELKYLDYVWIYLHAHGIRDVVLHEWSKSPPLTEPLNRLKAQLEPAEVAHDGLTRLYDAQLLPEPTSPVIVGLEGWGSLFQALGRVVRSLEPESRLALYVPATARPLTLTIEGAGLSEARVLEAHEGARLLFRASFPVDKLQTWTSEPFVLSPGLHYLTFTSDGSADSQQAVEQPSNEPTRYSLRIARIKVQESGSLAR